MPTIQKISPCLWFDSQGEDAAKFYVSIFDKSRIVRTAKYSDVGKEVHGQKAGTVMTVDFELEGQSFTALNGGPHFKFSEAISLQVMCETQEEIDKYWMKLSEGGDPKAHQCGWLKDKFGLSWQIVPKIVPELVSSSDTAKAGRVMGAVLKMKKLDIAKIKQAAEG
ncbi:MAG TPA: VOC family protein [Polyangiales bacterium]|jgi:predicted 3-demethylubiquinone-9 3-methyltransferase (glyoxalase superfamily)|nr:VOC family protein [Polyangiales bacterium]